MPSSQIAIQSTIWENNSILKQKRQNTKNQGYMPFLFRSKRQFPYDKNEIPPIGAYNVLSLFDKLTKSKVQNQPQILKQQFERKNQMCIFKSNQQRFSHNKNDIPGPASYNFMKNHSSNKFKPIVSRLKTSKQKLQLIKRSPTCPAIPDSKVRYGYLKDSEGNFRLIHKTQTQVMKEKEKLKEYCSTLVGQNHYSRNSRVKQSEHTPKQKLNHQKIVSKLEKYVDKRHTSSNQELSKSKDKKPIKPKIKLSHDVQPIKQSNDHLGPGCYNVTLDTVKKGKQRQDFQFFSSSEIRFAPLQKQPHTNPYENIFKEKKNMRLKPNLPGKIYKKSFPTSVDQTCFQKLENPGPGYYEPEVQKVKKSNGNVKFGSQSRFKQKIQYTNQSHQQQIIQQIEVQENNSGNSIMKWGSLRKQKIRSPHKQYQPVQQSQIYGIMNQEVSDSHIHSLGYRTKPNNKESAVFLDKSKRFNICNKTYYKGEIEGLGKEQVGKLWETKGSFMSKLPKKGLEMKENTPGPGAYVGEKVGKKTFNIKNY